MAAAANFLELRRQVLDRNTLDVNGWAEEVTYKIPTQDDLTITAHVYHSQKKRQRNDYTMVVDCLDVVIAWDDLPCPPETHHAIERGGVIYTFALDGRHSQGVAYRAEFDRELHILYEA